MSSLLEQLRGKIKLLEPPQEVKTDILSSPKLMGVRLIDSRSDISSESINYKEIVIEPLIGENKVLISLTYRDKTLDENIIRWLVVSSMELTCFVGYFRIILKFIDNYTSITHGKE